MLIYVIWIIIFHNRTSAIMWNNYAQHISIIIIIYHSSWHPVFSIGFLSLPCQKKHLRPAAVVHRCHFQWLEGRREAVPNPPPPRLWLPSLASQRFSPRPFKEIKETTGKAGNMKNLNSKHNKWKGWFGNMITLFLFKWSLKHWNSRMKFCSWLATYCQDATALNNMQQARLTHASKTRKLEVGCVW